MYSKKTRVHCYAFTLLPALIGLVLWSTNPQTVFPLVVLFTPVLLALTLALCLHLTEKLEKDREKNKKINSDYEAKRFHDVTLQHLEIVKAKPGLFNEWLKSKGKLGGQHKIPRLSNSRKNIDEMLMMNK